MQTNRKLLALMGLARKSGRLSAGFDAVVRELSAGRAKAVFLSGDVAQRTERNARRIAQEAGVPVCVLAEDMIALGAAVGAAKVGIVSINDVGFAKKALQHYEAAAQGPAIGED